MRARFWVYWNGSFVKLTLAPGERVSLFRGGPTDEGYFQESETYYFREDESEVVQDFNSWGSDCDGRFERGGTVTCNVFLLRAVTREGCPYPLPDWQYGGQYQRDYAAEAAGY